MFFILDSLKEESTFVNKQNMQKSNKTYNVSETELKTFFFFKIQGKKIREFWKVRN